MIDEKRGVSINIAGDEHELILTTRATQAIAKRYGGLSELGDKLLTAENYEMALSEIVWLITLLANQSILIFNLHNKENAKQLLTEDEVELLTSPFEIAEYNNAILEAIYKGTKREVESCEEIPNI